jgi:hypothetical protein
MTPAKLNAACVEALANALPKVMEILGKFGDAQTA